MGINFRKQKRGIKASLCLKLTERGWCFKFYTEDSVFFDSICSTSPVNIRSIREKQIILSRSYVEQTDSDAAMIISQQHRVNW